MRAILWDLDDTLLDSAAGRMAALAEAYRACLGQPVDAYALWRSHDGRPLADLARRLLGERHHHFTDAFDQAYERARTPVQPFAGIAETLASCRSDGLVLGVVTSRPSWGAVDDLGRAGLLEHFHTVVTRDDTDAHKPDPAPVFEALDRMLVADPAEALLVGDSPADILAARGAGCRSVGALWGTLDADRLREAGPGHLALEPADVLRVVEVAR